MNWAIWVTGPPGSGKTTLARGVAAALEARGVALKLLELDEVRKVVTPAPTYSETERDIVYRALAYLAKLLTEAGGGGAAGNLPRPHHGPNPAVAGHEPLGVGDQLPAHQADGGRRHDQVRH